MTRAAVGVVVSRGRTDLYTAFQKGQSIDITNVRDGTYVLIQEITTAFAEHGDNYTNNRIGVRLRLSGDRVTVLERFSGEELARRERAAGVRTTRARRRDASRISLAAQLWMHSEA